MRQFLVGFFLLIVLKCLGQDAGCLQTLNRANEEFSAGRFFGIPSILKGCLDNGFTNEQRIQAYHLLTQTYLILDDPIAAEDSYLRLLRVDPEYVASPDKDPIDLVYLSKKFTATPVFTPHFRVGGSVSIPRTIYEVTTEGYDVSRSNVLRPTLHFGAGVDWNYNDNLSVGVELTFSRKSFSTDRSSISEDDSQKLIERQSWLDVPLYIKYKDHLGKIRPFGYAGLALNLLLSSKAELRTENKNPDLTGSAGQVPTEGPNVDITYKRNLLNRSFIVGGGVYYKIGRDFIFADMRYMGGMSNLTKPSENFYNEDGTVSTTIGRYRWVGDYFRLDNLSLSIGYVRPLYNPRRVKKARTKKVLREINQEDN